MLETYTTRGLTWQGVVEWSATTPHGLFVEIWVEHCDGERVIAVCERHTGPGNPIERNTFYDVGEAYDYARKQRERFPWPLEWNEIRPR